MGHPPLLVINGSPLRQGTHIEAFLDLWRLESDLQFQKQMVRRALTYWSIEVLELRKRGVLRMHPD